MEKAKNGSNFFFLFIYIFSLVARPTQGEVSRPGRRFKTGTNGNEDSRPGTRPGTKIQDRGQDGKTGNEDSRPEILKITF